MDDDVVIATHGLTKDYGRRRAVDGLDLQVRRGQVFGFLGPNGAGKSTTIRMLLGLIRPTAGDCWLNGHRVGTARRRALERVGAIVEQPVFYEHLSGRRNLELLASFSGGAARERVDEVLGLVRLLGRDDDKVGAYSHGMKQRLGLAQALLPDNDLLILDEPSSGLDPEGMHEVRELIRRLGRQEGRTMLLSSHLLHEVEQVCTHVALIHHGRLIASGAVSELPRATSRPVTLLVDDSRRAVELLEGSGLAQVTAVADGRVDFTADVAHLADINALLVTGGLRVSGLIPERATLEDFYLEVVGHHAADGPAC